MLILATHVVRPKTIRDQKEPWATQLTLLNSCLFLNPLAILSTIFLSTNNIIYLLLAIFLIFSYMRFTYVAVLIGSVMMAIDYQYGTFVVFFLLIFNWRRGNFFPVVLSLTGSVGIMYYFSLTEGYLECSLYNFASVKDVGESLNPMWYFFVECFPQFKPIFIAFFTLFPYFSLIPIIRLTLKLSDNYSEYEKLPAGTEEKNRTVFKDKEGSEVAFKKLRLEVRVPLTEIERDNHFSFNMLIVLVCLLYFTKSYTVLFDFLPLIPLLVLKQNFASKATLAVLCLCIILYGIISQFTTWSLWRKRSLANPNFFFSDVLVSTAVLSIFAYNLIERQSLKNDRILVTLKELKHLE